MPWVPVLAAAGGLCLVFGLVEWLLSRLEDSPEKRSRALGFGLAGCACLVAFGFAFRFPQALAAPPAAGLTQAASVAAQLEQQLAYELSLIRQAAAGNVKPALAAISEARTHLFDARMALVSDPALQVPELLGLRSQADTLLGVAYQTLGAQWVAAKSGEWEDPARRTAITDQLQRELVKWDTLRECLAGGKANCLPQPTPSEKEAALRDLTLWLHPYIVELTRFLETDPDLVNSATAEIERLRALFRQAREELQRRSPGPWAGAVTRAADTLFDTADRALAQETVAIRQGVWAADTQVQVYAPIRAAFDQLFQVMLTARR